MSITHGWPVGRGGSRGFLDSILLRQTEIAFAFWKPQHTLLTHTELIVGENLYAPSGACPLGFGDAVPDSTFAWSCFILLDLAPCSGLGRSSLDPDSLPRPRPRVCQLLVFRSSFQQGCLHPGLLLGPLPVAWPQVETQALWQCSRVAEGLTLGCLLTS